MTGTSKVSAAGRLARWADAHPLIAVSLLVGPVVIGQAVAIWLHRHPGGLAGDEALYASDAFRLRRALFSQDVFLRFSAPDAHVRFVPLLSAFLLVVGPDDVRTVLMVLPLLTYVSCLAIVGITRRFTRTSTAIVAGFAFAVLPTTVAATQMYFFGLGVTASMLVALWALLASDGGSNSRIWVYGLAIGTMALSRTMSVAFVPVLALAGALHVFPGGGLRERQRWAGSVAMAISLAAPVYWRQRDNTLGYLLSNGYGPNEQRDFPGNPISWRFERFNRWLDSLGRPYAVLVLVVVVVAFVIWRRRGGRFRDGIGRPWLPVLVMVAGGYTALMSTANVGDWFDLPLIATMIPLVALAVDGRPRPVRGGFVVATALLATVSLGTVWWILPADVRLIGSPFDWAGFPSGEQPFEDERMTPAQRAQLRVASEEWWALYRRVDGRLQDLNATEGPIRVNFQGSATVFNLHVFTLVEAQYGPAELGFGAPVDEGCDEPLPGEAPTILVIPEGDSVHPGRKLALEASAEAAENCWVEIDRIPMPRHGDVVLYRAEPE